MQVYASAYGLAKFRKDDTSIYSLAIESARDLINRFKVDKGSIDGLIIATSSIEPYLASIVAEMLGIKPKVAYKHEQICSSGTSAIASAYAHISSGLCKNILVIGVDRYDTIGSILTWDKSRGNFKHPAHWAALYAKAYMRRFNAKHEQLAMVSVKNRLNALKNPYAFFNSAIDVKDVLDSKIVVEPLRLYECSYKCNGSSSILLTSEPSDKQVRIIGIGESSLGASIASIDSLTSIVSSVYAAREAYSMANVKPDDVDVVELHDAFSICQILALEDLGFARKGYGARLMEDIFDDNYNISINPRGGLLGSGHPIGATGIAQMVEVLMQLRHEARDRQVKDARIGLVHNMAAAGTSSNVIIMMRDD